MKLALDKFSQGLMPKKAVEDYDFDRLEVEAQQCVKLTSTNRPFGLIIKLSQSVFEGTR